MDINHIKKVAEQIGKGAHREVYEDSQGVVKIARKGGGMARNKWEYEIWQLAVEKGYSEYLVPVIDCAEDGKWLIMERAEPTKERGEVQKWMQDANKAANWGVHEGKTKLLDYGNRKMLNQMRKL